MHAVIWDLFLKAKSFCQAKKACVSEAAVKQERLTFISLSPVKMALASQEKGSSTKYSRGDMVETYARHFR